MHKNLERRFIELVVAQSRMMLAMSAFRARYGLLFNAVAEELGWSRHRLAKFVGFDPVPEGGNAVMNREAEPSNEDIGKLLAVYESKVAK